MLQEIQNSLSSSFLRIYFGWFEITDISHTNSTYSKHCHIVVAVWLKALVCNERATES